MNYENLVRDAIETTLAWDIPDEAFSGAVQAQASLMAGIPHDEPYCQD